MSQVEIGLLLVIAAMAGTAGGRFWMAGKHVRKDMCDERYRHICERLERIEGKLDKIINGK